MGDVMHDWAWLPNPATLRYPFAITNQTGSTVYVRSFLTGPAYTSLPAGWTSSPKDHGPVANSVTLYGYHEAQRTRPAFTAGEYFEQLEMRIELYLDPMYTNLIAVLTERLNIVHYSSSDPAFILIDEDVFEAGVEGWYNSPFVGEGDYYVERVPGKGYASTYAIRIGAAGQSAMTGQLYTVDGPLTGAIYLHSVPHKLWFDSRGLNIADQWHVVAGRHTLTGSQVGVFFAVETGTIPWGMTKRFNKPAGVTKMYFSCLVRFDSADNRWYLDNARWVAK